jgi:hypothetical protein
LRYTLPIACLVAVLLAGCATRISYPEPEPSQAQVKIELHGEAREGVTGPVTRSTRDNYVTQVVSVEQGRAFERVDYGSIEDVVVLLYHTDGRPVQTDAGMEFSVGHEAALYADDFGFSRYQVLLHNRADGLRVTNTRDTPITVYGFNEADDFFEVTVAAGETGTARIPAPGIYSVYCDEDEDAYAKLYVHSGGWIGPSKYAAFFTDVPPGDYEVHVYGPRLPVWEGRVTARQGQRATLTAELSVNRLSR